MSLSPWTPIAALREPHASPTCKCIKRGWPTTVCASLCSASCCHCAMASHRAVFARQPRMLPWSRDATARRTCSSTAMPQSAFIQHHHNNLSLCSLGCAIPTRCILSTIAVCHLHDTTVSWQMQAVSRHEYRVMQNGAASRC
jgi:hypothetical protein